MTEYLAPGIYLRPKPEAKRDVRLVRTDDQDHFVDVLADDPIEEMPEDRPPGQPDHRLRLRMRVGAHALAKTGQRNDDLHELSNL